MKYRVAKPLRYFHIGSEMDIDPNTPYYSRLIQSGILEPVQKQPKASKREKKVIEPDEVKNDGADE